MDGTKAITDTFHLSKPLEKLKQNTALVSQLFLSIQSRRDADMGEFFQNKKDLLKRLPQTVSEKPSEVTIRVYDGPAIAHILQPGQSVRTIGDYIEKLIIPYARNEASGSLQCMDWLWDVYPQAYLTRQAHSNLGDDISKSNGCYPYQHKRVKLYAQY